MKLAITIGLAYAATAVFYVWRDASERNPVRRTGYVISYRAGGSWIGLALASLGWFPGVLVSAYFKRDPTKMGREIAAIGFFLAAIVIMQIISN
jgi:hypothetical protein